MIVDRINQKKIQVVSFRAGRCALQGDSGGEGVPSLACDVRALDSEIGEGRISLVGGGTRALYGGGADCPFCGRMKSVCTVAHAQRFGR